jgi:hypothetical protein
MDEEGADDEAEAAAASTPRRPPTVPHPRARSRSGKGGAWIRPRGAQIRPTAVQFAGEGRG